MESIPGSILKGNQEMFTNILQKLFNDSIINGTFPPELKIGEIRVFCSSKGKVTPQTYDRLLYNI